MKTAILDASLMNTKEEAFECLKDQFSFPEYFGGNLDALYDCLTEMGPTQILLKNTEQAGEYYPKIRRVLQDAAAENDELMLRDMGDIEEDGSADPLKKDELMNRDIYDMGTEAENPAELAENDEQMFQDMDDTETEEECSADSMN